jgi:hypothetical protein
MSKISQKRGAAALLAGVATVAAFTGASAATTAQCSYTFSQTLKSGSKGVEVMNLQKVLNMNTSTVVATSGAGSMGNETMTFGSATKAAVMKFQAANGVSPVSGLVGPLTRAVLNQVCTGTGTTGTTTGTTTTTTTTTTGPVTVSLAGTQPSGVIVTGQAGAKLGDFVFSGNGTVQHLELTRGGVSSNQTLNNVYLYEGATRLTDAASISSDSKIRFNNVNLAVNGSRTISVRGDVATGTNGQLINVTATGMTMSGATTSTATNVAGPTLSIASVNTATIQVTNNSTLSVTANAGTMNQTLVDTTFNVGTRAVMVKALTYKFVGSAATSAVTNLGLFVDGVKIATGSINSNNRVVFDMTSAPMTLQTGNRQFQLRGDVVGGSFRQFQFSIETAADVMIEDSQLSGVNVTPTMGGNAINNVLGTNFNVSAGTLVVNQEPTFTETQVVGGASNATVGKFKVQAYGEDVKIETLVVTPVVTGTTPATTDLQNVALYVNGGAIGSQYNYSGTGNMTFNLGSQFIVAAGTSAVLEIKSDLRNSNGANYTAGTVRMDIASAGTVARGQSSQNSITIGTQTGRSLTMTSASASFGKTGGFLSTSVSPNTANVKVGSFTVSSGNAEDIVVTNLAANVTFGAGAVNTNYSNLKVADSSVIFGQFNAGVNNFSMNVTVPKNTTKTFDVYADLGTVPAAGTIKIDGVLSYRGANSGIVTTTASATGATLTANTATLGTPTLTSDSKQTQFVVGTVANDNIATFNIKAANGDATIQELGFTVAPSADVITTVTVGGISQNVTVGLNKITGLNILVANGNTGATIPVTVTYGNANQIGGVGSQTSATTGITLAYIKALSGNTVIETTPSVASNMMQLVASKPTVNVTATNVNVGTGSSTGVKLGTLNLKADAKGDIKVTKLPFQVALPTGGTGSNYQVRLNGSVLATATIALVGSDQVITFAGTGMNISAGQAVTLDVYGDIAGVTTSGNASTRIGTASAFVWEDVAGGATTLTGANVNNFGY